MSIILGIDPSIKRTGVSLFNMCSEELLDYKLIETGKIDHQGLTIELEAFEKEFKAFLFQKKGKITRVVIEQPSPWGGPRGGAAFFRDDYSKLCYSVGIIFCHIPKRAKIIWLPVSVWKGQVSKKIIRDRLVNKYKIPSNLDLNVSDSIGIVDYCFKKELV